MKEQAKSKRRLKRLSTNINTRTDTLLQRNRLNQTNFQQRTSFIGMSINDKITPFIERFHEVSERNLSPSKTQSARLGIFEQPNTIREEPSLRHQEQPDDKESSVSEAKLYP